MSKLLLVFVTVVVTVVKKGCNVIVHFVFSSKVLCSVTMVYFCCDLDAESSTVIMFCI